MSDLEKNTTQDRRSQLSLKSLYLDPNNYRFIDSENYIHVEEDQITQAEIQRRTTSLILGKNAEYVRDLIDPAQNDFSYSRKERGIRSRSHRQLP